MPSVEYQPLFGQLEAMVPQGFDGCTTIVQRVDTGGMVQEVTIFNMPNNAGPLSLYMVAAPIDGKLTPLLFNYNSAVDEVLDKMR